jgi:hypothetical protein
MEEKLTGHGTHRRPEVAGPASWPGYRPDGREWAYDPAAQFTIPHGEIMADADGGPPL